jgi:hypothetical protein
MKNFVVLYRVNEAAMAAMMTFTKEDQQKSMMEWHAWRDGLGDNLLDFGNMFFGGSSLNAKGISQSPGDVMGFTLIKAEDQEEANKLTESHPHIKWHEGASIEVREFMKMP